MITVRYTGSKHTCVIIIQPSQKHATEQSMYLWILSRNNHGSSPLNTASFGWGNVPYNGKQFGFLFVQVLLVLSMTTECALEQH